MFPGKDLVNPRRGASPSRPLSLLSPQLAPPCPLHLAVARANPPRYDAGSVTLPLLACEGAARRFPESVDVATGYVYAYKCRQRQPVMNPIPVMVRS